MNRSKRTRSYRDAVARGDRDWQEALANSAAGLLVRAIADLRTGTTGVEATLRVKVNDPIEGPWCRAILAAMEAIAPGSLTVGAQ
jgi:hypothetical protein